MWLSQYSQLRAGHGKNSSEMRSSLKVINYFSYIALSGDYNKYSAGSTNSTWSKIQPGCVVRSGNVKRSVGGDVKNVTTVELL